MLNIVPIASIAVEAAINRRQENTFAFLKIKQNLEAKSGHTEIFCNLAVKITFSGSTGMTPSSLFLKRSFGEKNTLHSELLN